MRRKSVKKIFIESLREANKEKGDQKLKELIQELKKRRFGTWTHKHLKKMIILAQREGGRKGAKFVDPRDKHWPDSFILNNTEIMLLWEEDLENEEDVMRMTRAFFDYDRYEMPYIM